MEHETIAERIVRLRKAKGWSRPQLAKEMAKALGGEAKAVTGEAIRRYEVGEELPRKRRRAMALVFGKDEMYLEFGEAHREAPKVQEHGAHYVVSAADTQVQNGREELVLHFFRGLFPEQQLRLVQNLRAAFESNNVTRRYLGNKPLTGVSDAKVRSAFGDAPFHTLKRQLAKKKKPGHPSRDPGAPMDDYLDE